jgi:hypothetical protein
VADIDHPVSSVRTYVWAILLGSAGLYFGYTGQFLLLKKSAVNSVAPLLGIFLTGPAGLFLGILLGTWSTRLKLSTSKNLILLVIAVMVVSAGTLYLAVAEFKETVRLVDAEILDCKKIDNLLESQTKMWSEAPAVVQAIARESNPLPRGQRHLSRSGIAAGDTAWCASAPYVPQAIKPRIIPLSLSRREGEDHKISDA